MFESSCSHLKFRCRTCFEFLDFHAITECRFTLDAPVTWSTNLFNYAQYFKLKAGPYGRGFLNVFVFNKQKDTKQNQQEQD